MSQLVSVPLLLYVLARGPPSAASMRGQGSLGAAAPGRLCATYRGSERRAFHRTH
jgi:hypothetical protein